MTNVAKLRHQLEVAQTLAKSHINFVVIPVMNSKDEFELAQMAAERLEILAKEAETNDH